MDKDEIIEKLEEENSKIIAENKKLKKLIHSIKISLEQSNTNTVI